MKEHEKIVFEAMKKVCRMYITLYENGQQVIDENITEGKVYAAALYALRIALDQDGQQ